MATERSLFFLLFTSPFFCSASVPYLSLAAQCEQEIFLRSPVLLHLRVDEKIPFGESCWWHVRTNTQSKLMFKILYINISSPTWSSCENYVEIRDGTLKYNKAVSGRICNSVRWNGQPFTTRREDAFIFFRNTMPWASFTIYAGSYHMGSCSPSEFSCPNGWCVNECNSKYDSCGDNSYSCGSSYNDTYIYIIVAILATVLFLCIVVAMCCCCCRDKRRRQRQRRRRERRALQAALAASMSVSPGMMPGLPPNFQIPDAPALASVPPYTPPAEPPPAYSTLPRRFTLTEDSVPKDDDTGENWDPEATTPIEHPPPYQETSFNS